MDTIGISMELIASAGDSRSYAMEAIALAKAGDFDEARSSLEKAKDAMVEAHEVQTGLLRGEMSGNEKEKAELSLLMVHAQDHLTMALLMRDMAREFIELYEKINGKEGK